MSEAIEFRSAFVSDDGLYRYNLVRSWKGGDGRVLWVMLNPSTADGQEDDQTIRKCVGYSQRWGYGSLEVVNLYAWRATDAKAIRRVADPIGPRNDEEIARAAKAARLVVVAWGAHSTDTARELCVLDLIESATYCLGLSKKGRKPRHPLMTAYHLPLVPFCASRAAVINVSP